MIKKPPPKNKDPRQTSKDVYRVEGNAADTESGGENAYVYEESDDATESRPKTLGGGAGPMASIFQSLKKLSDFTPGIFVEDSSSDPESMYMAEKSDDGNLSDENQWKLLLGRQTFELFREPNTLYIDKTDLIHQLIKEGSIYFLSRPRRFGKSLLISTLEALFRGRRELFRGLAIEQEGYAFKEHPVIRLDFSIGSENPEDMELVKSRINIKLDKIAADYSVNLPQESGPRERFRALIQGLVPRGKVVVLVDEYDKPILDRIDNPNAAASVRQVLKDFYEVLKEEDASIAFIFLTGVSKFSKVSLFSGLNNLIDISTKPDYATILGVTEVEIQRYLKPHLKNLAQKMGFTKDQTLNELQEWFDGYRFSSDTARVYNPWSLFSTLSAREFEPYWFKTGTPTFLLKALKEDTAFDITRLTDLEVETSAFDTFDLENLDALALLFQTGYITILDVTGQVKKRYRPGFPNYEVKNAFFTFLLESLTGIRKGHTLSPLQNLVHALKDADKDRFKALLNSAFFAKFNYDQFSDADNQERFYHLLFHAIMVLVGMNIHAEVRTNRGRADNIIETDRQVFVFEHKYNKTAEAALAQIKTKGYHERFENSGKTVHLIGVNFAERAVADVAWETLS